MRKLTYYDTLGVHSNSSHDDIKISYQKLILVNHPDKSDASDAAEKFRMILEAWRVLGSAEERKKYDGEVCGGSSSVVFGEETPLSEFSCPEDEVYIKTCRCGGEYEVLIFWVEYSDFHWLIL
jgi:DnaJ-class molecular chaperone